MLIRTCFRAFAPIAFCWVVLVEFPDITAAADKAKAKIVKAGCNCGAGRGAIVTASNGIGPTPVPPGVFNGPPPAPAPYGESFEPDPIPGEAFGPGPVGASPYAPAPLAAGPAQGGVNPNADGPPPGTIGMTYRRASRLTPSDKHPRIAMLEVSVEDAYDVWADGMKAYRAKDGIWRLETKEPMLPGVPHIYHIKATLGEGEDAAVEYRTVRLIPGRIVDLQW